MTDQMPMNVDPREHAQATGLEPSEEGPHWYLQEAGEGGLYLKIYANSMIEVNGTIIFQDAEMRDVARFEPGQWSSVEHGEE